jgi:large subunit ribosomal protein L10
MLKSEKAEEMETIKKLAESHRVIGVLNMHKLPARQLQQIRDNLRGRATIKMAKKSLIKRSVDKKIIHEKMEGKKLEPALLFSNENPFSLYRILKENRTPASAKPGDVTTKDIIVTQGPTPLPPGPAISTLQKVGIKASVQGGKIAVMQDKIVCKAGGTISEDIASVLNLLKIEPMEIGLDLIAACEDGLLYNKDVLDVDQDQYIKDIQMAIRQAVNLSVNTGYLTKLTAPMAAQKAFLEALTLCVDANIIEKDFIDEVLKKAVREAKALNSKTNIE